MHSKETLNGMIPVMERKVLLFRVKSLYLQHHCKYLKLVRNHKTAFAALLMALYVFTVTPVSYWHRHESNCNKYNAEQYADNVKKITASADINCKICSHHYSVIANDAISVYSSPVGFFNVYVDHCVLKKITNPGYCQSNKGPPAVSSFIFSC